MKADDKVIKDFGDEWKEYDYRGFDNEKLFENFKQYFSIFPWHKLAKNSEGFDMGCGSGRWAKLVAPRVGKLNCVEPSAAIEVAKNNLQGLKNIHFYNQTSKNCTIEDSSQDFGYCLGVLHHITDTEGALMDCARLLKPKAPLLLYIYYNFENRPFWFKAIWKCSDILRRLISIFPFKLKKFICEIIALLVYWPLARLAYLTEKLGFDHDLVPLADYRKKPFYQMRNDALDRFGTRLEKRFSKRQITDMLLAAGFSDVTFSNQTPYWCCVAVKS
ncbi:class I SAM-dependent methyltransferase [Candidatus Ponderosibacter sp. Uisw_141_02]|uniref:class I SAM-dependent methyltransferase n=1 Tax=Candidatus Ponderosibacter sp. Uisw_141_02 TaxID=3231000 RepID=UPI003D3FF436